ncbi:Crp/Fnr family transcriptional regulator [Acinetobacter chinensis]|uniref:Crp/Fnr family transcriptional regulator n=1 Tax=Acinetobacter chinensis TaxID=2004650 RepID=A0ABU3WEL2_9GAMM|nr:Crp/Fnr family transcriptional regulator [Acinetobacter chinensis]MDV2468854.1 Crp/Fnr family transcriptional regulator [Acinetobacter chinensis]
MFSQNNTDQLSNNLWFSNLDLNLQQYILKNAVIQHYEKDHTIFQMGNLFDGIYAVLTGSVRLGYIDIEGNESVAAYVEPIMWFGEISLVDKLPRSHNAVATQKCEILYLSDTAIQTLLQQNPGFWFHIAQLTSQKLRHAFLELISIQTQTISQRLAQRLLFILQGYGNHAQIEQKEIHFSQEQLAQMLMCSRQTINQELQQLERKGIIRIAFKKIEIINFAELHQIAHSHHEKS